QLIRTDGNPVTVCWTFDTCESCAGPASVSESTDVVSNLNVYPNPADDQLNIQFEASVAQRMTLRMVNSVGQVVLEENMGQVNGQKVLSINTSSFAPGIYALTLSNPTGSQVVNVVIK
ncbi:MAG: T9SS type A sorting domain-containing protein, partial [Flavobacteriales bacterium]